MGESRTELLAWLNELLQVSYTKIEQCGAGGAYCQILDSIYGDVPMSRVKMQAKHEYEYLANYKIMQNVFKAKKIDKEFDKLTKCKMQYVLLLQCLRINDYIASHQRDNLEFLQWMKKFWDQNYGGQPYDPVARRKGAPGDIPATVAPITSSNRLATGAAGARAGGRTPVGGPRAGSAVQNETIINLQNQLREVSTHLEGLEKERDFYFAKLRDIEILVQAQLEALEAQDADDVTLKEIQKILYSTEEGFEVPENGAALDEEETF
ncbi:EB1 domain-containing protein [Hysterangium stoloniferum]|nr:EB1 domain-containing protein [Hysterangium stoloniferum]